MLKQLRILVVVLRFLAPGVARAGACARHLRGDQRHADRIAVALTRALRPERLCKVEVAHLSK